MRRGDWEILGRSTVCSDFPPSRPLPPVPPVLEPYEGVRGRSVTVEMRAQNFVRRSPTIAWHQGWVHIPPTNYAAASTARCLPAGRGAGMAAAHRVGVRRGSEGGGRHIIIIPYQECSAKPASAGSPRSFQSRHCAQRDEDFIQLRGVRACRQRPVHLLCFASQEGDASREARAHQPLALRPNCGAV